MSDSTPSQSKPTGAIAAGLFVGLSFGAGFFLVGYSLLLSLCMGLLGGASAYQLVKWWHIEEVMELRDSRHSQSAIAPLRESWDRALLKSGLKKQKTHPRARYPKRPVSIVEWIVRRNSTRKR